MADEKAASEPPPDLPPDKTATGGQFTAPSAGDQTYTTDQIQAILDRIFNYADEQGDQGIAPFQPIDWEAQTTIPIGTGPLDQLADVNLATLMQTGGVDVVVEATGNPAVGLTHAREALRNRLHIIMVNVEADVLAGPLLADEARQAGVVYSMAYGDQPALTCELVEWARATGFDVVAAGKGTKYLPEYHSSTPDTVWDHYGLTPEQAAEAGMNSQMFNSFLDGTKSALEMAAIANATGLTPPPDGLLFPPAVGFTTRARSRWFIRLSETAVRCSRICAGESMW